MLMKLKKASLVFLLSILPAVTTVASSESPFKAGTHGRSSLGFVGPVPVLHLYGTPAEMGEAAGTLMREQLQEMAPNFIRQYLDLFTLRVAGPARDGTKKRIMAAVNEAKKTIPADRLVEMKAMARASGLAVDIIIEANLLPEIAPAINCSTVFISAKRMKKGGAAFGRNLDYPNIGDIARYGLVVVYHENGCIPLATFSFPGFIGALTGINKKGLSGATMDEYQCSTKKRVLATPRFLFYRRLLGGCVTLHEVEKAVKGEKCLSGGNFMVVDARDKGGVFESDGESWHLRRSRGGMVYATNHFRSAALVKRPGNCNRYKLLAKKDKEIPKFSLDEVKKLVKASAQLFINVQAMVIRPRERQVYFAFGRVPAVLQGFKPLEARDLFPGAPKPATRGKER